MAKNLTLGRILALMPHCCNKNGNGNSIIGYSEAIGSYNNFNELSQTDIDRLTPTKGIAILLYIPQFMSGPGPGPLYSLSINESTSIEANVENEEVINDL